MDPGHRYINFWLSNDMEIFKVQEMFYTGCAVIGVIHNVHKRALGNEVVPLKFFLANNLFKVMRQN